MFWTWLYFWLTCLTMGFVLVSRRRDLLVADLILLTSWLMTNTVLLSDQPDIKFLVYFAFDMFAFEVMAFTLIRRWSWWAAVVMLALGVQLLIHVHHWIYNTSTFAYHEQLNVMFWVIAMSIMLACVIPPYVPNDAWLKPRPIRIRHPNPLLMGVAYPPDAS